MFQGKRGKQTGSDERNGFGPGNIADGDTEEPSEKQPVAGAAPMDAVNACCRWVGHQGAGRQLRAYQKSHIAL